MTANTIAQIAFEAWYAMPRRDRTLAALDAKVDAYAASYFGPSHTWQPEILAEVGQASTIARGKVRPWHVEIDQIDSIVR